MAFDPLSSQGLVGALAGGIAAAQAICRDNGRDAFADVASRHAEILAIYDASRSAAYAREHRWSGWPFWAAHHGSSPTTASLEPAVALRERATAP